MYELMRAIWERKEEEEEVEKRIGHEKNKVI